MAKQKPEGMNLIVDIGNTFVKLAVYEQDTCLWSAVEQDFNKAVWEAIFFEKKLPSAIIVSSTRSEMDLSFIPKGIFVMQMDQNTSLPIKINYDTPDTLGKDRIAAAVGFVHRFPNTRGLVIDAGTCITYEYIDANVYQGGSISPGLQMRLKAMNAFTGKLPLIHYSGETVSLLAKSTETALLSGAVQGAALEITATIAEYKAKYGVEQVVITGGDAQHFEKQVKNTIFAAPLLVLEGLNQILRHNVQNL